MESAGAFGAVASAANVAITGLAGTAGAGIQAAGWSSSSASAGIASAAAGWRASSAVGRWAARRVTRAAESAIGQAGRCGASRRWQAAGSRGASRCGTSRFGTSNAVTWASFGSTFRASNAFAGTAWGECGPAGGRRRRTAVIQSVGRRRQCGKTG